MPYTPFEASQEELAENQNDIDHYQQIDDTQLIIKNKSYQKYQMNGQQSGYLSENENKLQLIDDLNGEQTQTPIQSNLRNRLFSVLRRTSSTPIGSSSPIKTNELMDLSGTSDANNTSNSTPLLSSALRQKRKPSQLELMSRLVIDKVDEDQDEEDRCAIDDEEITDSKSTLTHSTTIAIKQRFEHQLPSLMMSFQSPTMSVVHEEIESAPLITTVMTYLSYLILTVIGHFRDTLGKFFFPFKYAHLKEQNGYAPLVGNFESFFTRRLFRRIRDCWNRPVTGVPGAYITYLERVSHDFNETFELTGRRLRLDNLASYNYLGFAESKGPCTDSVIALLNRESVEMDATRSMLGTIPLHQQLEQEVARFVGKEDSMVFGMGFGTNATMIPALVGRGCLIISDELSHASLVTGCMLSGAAKKTFKHNDPIALEQVLRESIALGQPRTHRPWKKILVIIEGLYSMEGTIARLPAFIALKHRYKFYLFIDEAHSIGALGPNGKGVCDFWGIDPANVDLLMGTFTKSFGAVGGYIASSSATISYFRTSGHGYIYCEPMAPVIAQQVLNSLRIIASYSEKPNREGTSSLTESLLSSPSTFNRVRRIQENSRYFMRRLRELGFIVYGDMGSPIILLLIFNPAKIAAFSREALKRGMALVVVGYPATDIVTSRVRFCISAAHTREQLDRVLERVSEIGNLLQMKLSRRDNNHTHKRNLIGSRQLTSITNSTAGDEYLMLEGSLVDPESPIH